MRFPQPLSGTMPRWALAPFAFLPWWTAYWQLTGDPRRFGSPSYAAARQSGAWIARHLSLDVQPMHVWGTVWLAAALWLTVAIALFQPGGGRSWRTTHTWVALMGLFALCTWWCIVTELQAVRDVFASPTAGGFIFLAAYACFLAALRIGAGDTTTDGR